jgi:hypothetical protein
MDDDDDDDDKKAVPEISRKKEAACSSSGTASSGSTSKVGTSRDDDADSDFSAVAGGYVHVDSGEASDSYGNRVPDDASTDNLSTASTSPASSWKRRVGNIPSANSGEFTWNPISKTYSDDGTLFVGEGDEEGEEGAVPVQGLGSGNSSALTVGRARAAGDAARAESRSSWGLDSWFTFPSRLSLLEMVGRGTRSVLAHPFYMVALLMVKDTTLRFIASRGNNSRAATSDSFHDTAVIGLKDINPISLIKSFKFGTGNNWVSVFLELAATKGFVSTLFRGMRSLLVVNLIPYNLGFCGLGILETLLFRRMLRPVVDDEIQDIRDLSRDAHLSTHHRITSASLTAGTRGLFVEAQSIITKHGAWGMLSYFYMTCLQIVPGFFSFLSARVLLFLAMGPTQTRLRQLSRRKELLRLYLSSKTSGLAPNM